MTHDHLVDAEVHAFVDGQLDPDARRRVMAALATAYEDAARASDYRWINEALHLTYDEVLHEPVPARLDVRRYRAATNVNESIFRRGPAQSAFALRAAALVALALTSGLVGWSLNDRIATAPVETAATNFTRMAAFAHQLYAPEANYPVEFGGGQEDTLLLWLSERLGTSVRAPNLEAIGFVLIGGRLLPSASGSPAGQLMYENQEGKRITLNMRTWADVPQHSTGDYQPHTVSYFGEENGFSIVYWAEPDLAYALIGQMDRDELLATGGLIQEQLQAVPLPASPGDVTAVKGAT